jgi:hypothetical protein
VVVLRHERVCMLRQQASMRELLRRREVPPWRPHKRIGLLLLLVMLLVLQVQVARAHGMQLRQRAAHGQQRHHWRLLLLVLVQQAGRLAASNESRVHHWVC